MASLKRRLLSLTRTVHIYVTLLVLAFLLLFSLTGLMLNHKQWFGLGGEQAPDAPMQQASGTVPTELLAGPDKDALLERLREQFGAAGEVATFEADPEQIFAVIERPGYRASVTIDRKTGKAELTAQQNGLASVVTDLHKGAHTGAGWRLLIDATAIALLTATVSGLILWLSLPKRRLWGAVAVLIGAAACLAAYALLVPR